MGWSNWLSPGHTGHKTDLRRPYDWFFSRSFQLCAIFCNLGHPTAINNMHILATSVVRRFWMWHPRLLYDQTHHQSSLKISRLTPILRRWLPMIVDSFGFLFIWKLSPKHGRSIGNVSAIFGDFSAIFRQFFGDFRRFSGQLRRCFADYRRWYADYFQNTCRNLSRQWFGELLVIIAEYSQ